MKLPNLLMRLACILILSFMGIRIYTKQKRRRHHVMQIYKYKITRISCYWNEVLQNMHFCVFNHKFRHTPRLALWTDTRPFIFVQHLVQRYCGNWWIAASRHVRLLGFRYSLWRMLLVTVLWDVTWLTFVGRAGQGSGCKCRL